MAAILLQLQRLHRDHMRKVERSIEMGEQLAAARRLPAKPLSQPLGVNGDKDQISLAHEVGGQGPGDLVPADR